MEAFLDTISNLSRPVVIFGASVIGKAVLDCLDILSISPAAFCDNDAIKWTQPFHGRRVISYERLSSEYPDAVVIIAAERYFDEIRDQLAGSGFGDVFSYSEVIGCINVDQVPRQKLGGIMWHLARMGSLSKRAPGELHVPRLNVVITTRCTLRCHDCSSLMPSYREPSDSEALGVIASVDRVLSAVDLIYHVEVLGGEPFLHPGVFAIAKHLSNTDKVLHVDVVTNGTVLPVEENLRSLAHERLSVVIDDYAGLSKKLAPLSEALARCGVNFRVNRHWAWADLGGFQPRFRAERDLKKLFARCNFNSCAELLDGTLYHCPRSSHGTKTGLVPQFAEDVIPLADLPHDEVGGKAALRKFFLETKYVRACDYCDGNSRDSLTLIPALQRPGERTR